MGQIDTNKKLELIRDIRMNHQNNREIMGRREQIIYGKSRPLVSRGEIYGLESAAINEAIPAEAADTGDSLRSFKVRMVIAAILFVLFFLLDRTGQSFAGITASQVNEAITTESKDIFSFINGLFQSPREDVKGTGNDNA